MHVTIDIIALLMACRWLIQDTLKVLTYKLLFAFDIFQIKSGSFTGKDGHGPGTERLLGIEVSSSWNLKYTCTAWQ